MPKRERYRGIAASGLIAFVLCASQLSAAPIDSDGEIQLGLRAYTAVRIGTEDTNAQILSDGVRQTARNVTFPVSTAGALRQHRVFTEVELKHNITRLWNEGFGPFALLNKLPFKMRRLKYYLAYRGEFEGIYDYGPSEFRTHEQWNNPVLVQNSPFPDNPNVPTRAQITARDRGRLRDVGTVRNRLFQAYVQAQVGPITARFGRQILAWGETDIFRLLDNINPLDASFGGFLVSLDERRVPLDMLRMTWYLGDFSRTGIPGLSVLSKLPFYESYLEGFIAIDDDVGFSPGVATGSAWGPPNVNVPTLSILTQRYKPSRNFEDARGGFQFRTSTPFPGISDLALGFAHYYTYFDIPAVRVMGQGFPNPISAPGPAQGFPIWAQQVAPRVQVTGVFGNFALPPEWVRPLGISGEPIIRFETAYFKNEPRNAQSTVDPFTFSLGGCPGGNFRNAKGEANPDQSNGATPEYPYCSAGARTGDSWNVVLGLDINQWIRYLNPNSSFFITTQFFYRHLKGAEKRVPLSSETLPGDNRLFFDYLPGQEQIYLGEVLPVQRQVISSDIHLGSLASNTDAAVPNFVHNAKDQFLQTLLITSPYYGGRLLPSLGIFYDWGNSWVIQPSLTYSVDPFRFTVTYNYLNTTALKGNQGISLLQDRDNLLFQFEYVI